MDFFLNEILEDAEVKQFIWAQPERQAEGRRIADAILSGAEYDQPDSITALFVLAHLADSALEKQLKNGISRGVIIATLKDVNLWIGNHRKVHGAIGVMEFGWLLNHYHRLNILRLGRLQFQLRKPSEGKECCIDTHVPQDEPLTPEACLASLEEAKRFYAAHDPDCHPAYFACHSWLLCPNLAEILPEDSNIVRFMRLWTQKPCAPDNSAQAIQRVFGFGFPAEKLAEAPENTSLQRSLKRYLLQGGTLNACEGYIRL